MPKQFYEAVIGLEIHAQLLTETKIFCGCSTRFGNPPNTNVCPVCLGHPGVLPVLNKKVVEYCVKMGLAVNCTVNEQSIMARKNYFYPDLPKGYQISQYDKPICEQGMLVLRLKDGAEKTIRVKRIHIEEDAGKSIHGSGDRTLIDVNRCGVPLIEIVSEPDMRSGEEAAAYVAKMRQILRYLKICDGNMEEGSLRCDANVSIRPAGAEALGTKTEIKNMNSVRNIERAITAEIARQTETLEDGGTVVQQTLLWNADAETLKPMRSKEEAHDYRYFPDPDLLPVKVSKRWKEEILLHLPELPDARKNRFLQQYALPAYDAEVLTQETELADYYEAVCEITTDYKLVSNWVMGEVLRVINEMKIAIDSFTISPARLSELLQLISSGQLSNKMAKEVFSGMLAQGRNAREIVGERGLSQVSNEEELSSVIAGIVKAFPEQFRELREGKDKVFGFFVGKVMKETKGKANPQLVNNLLKRMLEQ